VAALVNLVEVDEFVIGLFCPTARGLIALARKDAHGSRDGDVCGIQYADLVFPLETSRRFSLIELISLQPTTPPPGSEGVLILRWGANSQFTRLQGSLGPVADVQLVKDVVNMPLDGTLSNG
jgi:hypothetical protein